MTRPRAFQRVVLRSATGTDFPEPAETTTLGEQEEDLAEEPTHHVLRSLTDGLVITIEPIISVGSGAVRQSRDGWTIKTADGAISAHVEHTVVITDGPPLILTA